MDDALNVSWQDRDTPLLDAAREGSAEAFGELVDRYHQPIWKYLCRLTNDVETARDLTQDTFLDALRSISEAPEDRSFRVWLFVIARNNYLSYQRRQRFRRLISLDHMISSMLRRFHALQVEDPNERVGEDELVQMALEQLPASRREPVVLLSLGYSIDEIAEILELTPVATRQRLSRGLRQLRTIYLTLDQEGGRQ